MSQCSVVPELAPSWWSHESGRRLRISDTWAPIDFDDETIRLGASEGALKRICRNGLRTFFGPAGGSGTADLMRFDNGAEINVVNCVLPTLARWSYDADEPLIMLRASLSCGVAFHVQGALPMLFNRPELTLACVPKGLPLTVDILGGVRQQGVIGAFRMSSFVGRYGLHMDDLPLVVRDALSGTDTVGRIASLPLDHRVAALVADTIDSPLHGEMRAVQYAGRLAELVAYTLDALRHAPTDPAAGLLRWRDMDLAQVALEWLSRDYRKPPLFNDLAREIGTNPNKLKASFKSAFGTTMAEYCLERRMREAQQLLLEAKLTIAQVAERVGYEHQSSFAAAFSRHIGMSPREYRQHRAPFSLPLSVG